MYAVYPSPRLLYIVYGSDLGLLLCPSLSEVWLVPANHGRYVMPHVRAHVTVTGYHLTFALTL